MVSPGPDRDPISSIPITPRLPPAKSKHNATYYLHLNPTLDMYYIKNTILKALPPPDKTTRKLMIITVTLAVLAIIMSVFAHALPRFPGDLELTLQFQSVQSEVLFQIMKWTSSIFGSWRSVVLVIGAAILIYWRFGKHETALVITAGIVSLSSAILKIIIGRPRPTADLARVFEIQLDKSFPSGHSLFAMMLLGILAYLCITRLHRRMPRIAASTCLILLTLLVGASRIYLGEHWLSDVLGGFLFGGVFLGIIICFDRLMYQKIDTTLPPQVKFQARKKNDE